MLPVSHCCDTDMESSSDEDDKTDSEMMTSFKDLQDKTAQQRRRLVNIARASERHAVSDRAAAEIASAVFGRLCHCNS